MSGLFRIAIEIHSIIVKFYRARLKQSYVFLGKELGARSLDDEHYLNSKVQYERLAKSTLFKAGLDRLEQGLSRYRVCIMCAEKDPLDCHRTILVSRHLLERGVEVRHILANADIETQADAMHRLLRELRINSTDLFRSPEDLLREAYIKQSNKIAYVRP